MPARVVSQTVSPSTAWLRTTQGNSEATTINQVTTIPAIAQRCHRFQTSKPQLNTAINPRPDSREWPRPGRSPPLTLAGIQFDDELLLNRECDFLTHRVPHNPTRLGLHIHFQPGRQRSCLQRR